MSQRLCPAVVVAALSLSLVFNTKGQSNLVLDLPWAVFGALVMSLPALLARMGCGQRCTAATSAACYMLRSSAVLCMGVHACAPLPGTVALVQASTFHVCSAFTSLLANLPLALPAQLLLHAIDLAAAWVMFRGALNLTHDEVLTHDLL